MNRIRFGGLAAAILFLLAAPARAGSITGRLIDDAGRPVAGAKVTWEPFRSDEERLVAASRGADPAPAGETATDAEGKFRVVLDKPGMLSSIRILSAGPSVLLEGPYEAAETTDLEEIQLPAVEKVSGRVTDEAGKAVSGAKVRLGGVELFGEDTRFYAETVTGSDGAYTFSGAPEGAREMTVRAPGFVPFQRTRLDRRSAAEKVSLKRGGTVRGTVLDRSGQPAAGAIVMVGAVATEADAAGAYRLEGVVAGSRSVEAFWKDDFAARKDAVAVRKGEEVEVALRLARASSISGTVIDEKTRRPVAGASVRAGSSALAMRLGGETPGPLRRARSDARGRFRIGGLLPRRYTVSTARDGYLSTSIEGVVASIDGRSSVALALTPAASITGTVTSEDGKPIAGARVRLPRAGGPMAMLMRNPGASLLGEQGARTRTDGSYRLKQLPASRSVTVEASKEGFAAARKHGLALKAGETVRSVNLTLPRGLEARGQVINAAGEPVAGAEVRISPAERGGEEGGIRIVTRMMRRDKPDAVTGRDGSFAVSGLEEGDVTAAVSHPDFAEKSFSGLSVKSKEKNEWPPFALATGASITGFVRDAQGAPIVGANVGAFGEGSGMRESSSDLDGSFRIQGLGADRPVMLNARADGYAWVQKSVTPPAEGVVITLKTSGIVRGRVEEADTKRPVTDFSVGSFPMRGGGGFMIRMGGGPQEKAFQSADGSFELAEVPPGRWSIRASAPGYRSAEVSPVEVAEGETKEGIVVSLKKGGALSGRVLDPRRGTGVANASVTWQEPSPGAPGRQAAALMARLSGSENATTTDADGRFQLDGLPEGKITLTASHADFLDASKEVDADVRDVEITLSTGGTLAGTVVGRDGRSPVVGASVALSALGDTMFGFGGTEPARTDGAGNFLFEHLAAGRYRVSASAAAGQAPPKEVVLTEGQRLDGVLLAMATGTTVKGTVAGLPAGSLGGVRISAGARDYSGSATTDESGRFLLRDVPPGSLRIVASTAMLSGRNVVKNFEVPEGASELPVEIVFETGSRLSGRITRGDRPVASAFVNASPDPPSPTGSRASAQTDDDGRYVLEGLTDGSYQLFVSGQGVSYRKSLEVAGDTTGDIHIPAVSISGVVTEASSSEPIEGVLVRAEASGESTGMGLRQAVTDSRGFYSLEGLDSATYRLTARKEGYQPKEQPVTVGSSSHEVNLALARGAGLQISASDGQTGLPLRGVTLSAYAGGRAAFTGAVALDSEGKGEISSLAPGTYSLYVFSQGYAPRVLPVVSVPSGPLAVALTPGGRVEVRSDALVNARILDGTGTAYVLNPYRTDGRVNAAPPLTVWENVAPGTYQLLVTTPTGEKSYPFTVTEGRTTAVEVR
jgi:hypothetical protein